VRRENALCLGIERTSPPIHKGGRGYLSPTLHLEGRGGKTRGQGFLIKKRGEGPPFHARKPRSTVQQKKKRKEKRDLPGRHSLVAGEREKRSISSSTKV